MYQVAPHKDTEQWPAAAPDQEQPKRRDRTPLESASLPDTGRAAAAKAMTDLKAQTVSMVFDELDMLADTLPGRNAITAVFKKLGSVPEKAIIEYARAHSSAPSTTREETLLLDDYTARGKFRPEEVYAIHYITGADVSRICDRLPAIDAEQGNVVEAAYQEIAHGVFPGKSGLVDTLQDLTGVPEQTIREIMLEHLFASEQSRPALKDLLRNITRAVIAHLATDSVVTRGMTIGAISEVLRDRDEAITAQVTEEYKAAFDRMYNPRPADLFLPLFRESVKSLGRAALFLFDVIVTENLPRDLKQAFYRLRGQEDLDTKWRSWVSAPICGGLYGLIVGQFLPPRDKIWMIFAAGMGTVVELFGRAMANDLEYPSEGIRGSMLLELIYWPIKGTVTGLKGFFNRVIENERQRKKAIQASRRETSRD